MAFLSVLLLGGGYASYIASWQFWILIAATTIFALLVLCNALFNSDHDHEHDHHDHDHGGAVDHWLQTIIHAFPLFFIIAIGVTSLGSQQIKQFNRPAPESVMRAAAAYKEQPTPTTSVVATASKTTTQTDTQVLPATPPATASFVDGPTSLEPGTPITNTNADPVVANAPLVPLPLVELYFPFKHPGVLRVETIGRLLIPTAEEIANVPPDVDRADLKLLLFRYLMTCCAADAQPVYVVLRNREAGDLKIDTWVKVTGAWIHSPAHGEMAKIEVETIEVIPEPIDPYMLAPK
jgi:uncharacterized membrane protein YcgQ (UPF0703/DUF1980 family)